MRAVKSFHSCSQTLSKWRPQRASHAYTHKWRQRRDVAHTQTAQNKGSKQLPRTHENKCTKVISTPIHTYTQIWRQHRAFNTYTHTPKWTQQRAFLHTRTHTKMNTAKSFHGHAKMKALKSFQRIRKHVNMNAATNLHTRTCTGQYNRN